jgi:hypothetical protein
MQRSVIAVLAILLALALGPVLAQDVPGLINYQGSLTDNTPQQNPINAALPMEFRIYGSQTGSDLLWQESWGFVQVINGIFNVQLGSQGSPVPTSLFGDNPTLYLEIVVLGETLAPRQRLASVPYSHVAGRLGPYEGADLEESAEIDAEIASHDLESTAHAGLFATHDHDATYYTESEIDALFSWGGWNLVDNGGDQFCFEHPDGLGQPIPVMTLDPPTSGGNVGIGTTTPAAKLDVAGAIKIGDATGLADGTIRYTGADFEGRVAGTWASLSSSDATRVDIRSFGAVGDGVTDDTLAVQAAINSLSSLGGIVVIPEGHYVITGQIVFPNEADVSGIVYQPPIKLEGAGAYVLPRTELSLTPSYGSILDLRYTDGPKIATYGTGMLEATGVTFADLDMEFDDAPFIYTTNTTLHIHDSSFYGRLGGYGVAQNDAIILGGTSSANPGHADPNGPFQGYGTVIRDNFFMRIRRAVYGRVFANGVAFVGNTIWSSCGSDLPDGAAIEIDGDPDGLSPQSASGWYVAGNLIEMVYYPYGIKTRESQRNAFIANNFFDPADIVKAYYRFEDSGKLNYVLAGFHDDNKPFVEDHATGNARSTVIDFHQNRESSYAQKVRFQNGLFLDPGHTAPFGPRLLSLGGTELPYQLATDDSMMVSYTPSGGSSIPLWQIRDLGGGIIAQELKGTDSRIRNGSGAVRIQSQMGSFLELGNVAGQGMRVEDGQLEFTTTAVQFMSGNGPPTADAPNGSVYLRADGAAGSTFYVREAGVWVAK